MLWDLTVLSRPHAVAILVERGTNPFPHVRRRPVTILVGHATPVTMVAFSPDGTTLATRARDGVLLWDVTHPTHPILVHPTPIT